MAKPNRTEREEAKVKLAQDGMRAIGIDPTQFSTGMQMPREYADSPITWDNLVTLFALFVADEPTITEESVQRARQRMMDSLKALAQMAREVKALQKGEGE